MSTVQNRSTVPGAAAARTGRAVGSGSYGRRMRTDQPLARLQRRLGAQPDPDGVDDESGEETDAQELLPRWLPDRQPPPGARWLGAIRADPGRAGAIALAVVAAIAVLITVFTLVRDKPAPVVSAKLPPVEMVSSASPRPSASPPARPDQPVVVSVVGLVHTPGLVTVAPDARIADALTAAGGALDGADMIGLNMARHVADGEQIIVGIASAPGEPRAPGSSVSSTTSTAGTAGAAPATSAPTKGGEVVDLNTATVEQLDSLPGVGPVTAAAIVAWRDANGKFTSVDQLGDVDGIGPARLDKLRNLVRV